MMPGQLPVRRLGVPHASCVLRILCENKHAKKSNWLVRLKELNDLKLEIFLEDHLITETVWVDAFNYLFTKNGQYILLKFLFLFCLFVL